MDRANIWSACGRCGAVLELVLGTPIKPNGRADLHAQVPILDAHARRSPRCAGGGVVAAQARRADAELYARVRHALRHAEGRC